MARHKEFEVNEVLDKAIQLFWMQGYEKTSMQDLVENMGIHRRSIYDTFGDKHALFMKAINRYVDIQNKNMRLLLVKQEPVKKKIQQFLESVLEETGNPQGCLIVNSGVELGLLDPEVSSFVEESYLKTEEFIYKLMLVGQQTGEISSQFDPKALSHYFMNAWLGLRTIVKTTTNQKKLSGIIHTTLSILD
ncbi:MAG: TetR family transcriptional regulator [Paenibacillaceae bacterium]|nr:TetR family transcriptional regulator [Paenibacillaceae bacterium]